MYVRIKTFEDISSRLEAYVFRKKKISRIQKEEQEKRKTGDKTNED
jgi:hypothetical protein